MKTIVLAIVLVTQTLNLLSQGVFSNSTNIALEKVIGDYPNQFKNIKGALLVQNGQASNYASSIIIPGSVSCIVLQSNTRQTNSWKADLFSSSSFDEARSRYTELYNQIKNTVIKVEGTKPYILSGQYAAPAANKSSHTIVFSMLPASGELQRVKVEISLEQQGSTWKLQLAIYDDKDDQLVRAQ